MKCPVDDETLLMTQRDGVEIDYCPKCRGVWLDRGELDKIIEKSIGAAPAVQLAPPPDAQPTFAPAPQPQYAPQPQPQYQERREPRYDDRPRYDERRRYDDDDYRYKGKRKKRESFLSELFDF